MDFDNLNADEARILTKHYTRGRGGHRIDKVVVHHNAANLTIEQCWDVWQTREASAHYQVQSDGRIGQLVWDSDTAWHCGNYAQNQRSIGIEHADCSSNPWRISDEALDSGAHLVAAICKYYGLGRPQWGVNLFGHSDFKPTECPASLAKGGSQHDEYVSRAQYWYNVMTGNITASKTGVYMRPADLWEYTYNGSENCFNALQLAYMNTAKLIDEANELKNQLQIVTSLLQSLPHDVWAYRNPKMDKVDMHQMLCDMHDKLG